MSSLSPKVFFCFTQYIHSFYIRSLSSYIRSPTLFRIWHRPQMVVCRSTLSAVSRSRVAVAVNLSSASKTLVPFLYHTATIQQWKPAAYPIARRSASSRSPRDDDDIPFEHGEPLPPAIDDPTPARKTTITGSERQAFEKLYKKFSSAEEHTHDEIPFRHEIDQIADEWYEEDEDGESAPAPTSASASASLDSVFDAVLAGLPAPGQEPKHKKVRKPAGNLQTLAENILRPEVEQARRKPKPEALAEAARIKGMREADKTRVQGLLQHAQTDRELWDILEREVFDMLRRLDLDNTTKSIEQQLSTSPTGTSKTSKPVKDDRNDLRRVLFPNYPSHLIFATNLLRTKFPSSLLPLSIIPTIKSLGRSSYALGATTTLYNIIIRTVWVQLASYDHLDQLLTDMDNGGIEPDTQTLEILDGILGEYQDAIFGRFGPSLQAVYRMDHYTEGAKKLQTWREVTAKRLGALTEKIASEGRLIRKFDPRHTTGARARQVHAPKDRLKSDFSVTA